MNKQIIWPLLKRFLTLLKHIKKRATKTSFSLNENFPESNRKFNHFCSILLIYFINIITFFLCGLHFATVYQSEANRFNRTG